MEETNLIQSTEFVMPSVDPEGNNENLVTDGVEEAIGGETVSEIMVESSDNIMTLNYVIDLRSIESLSNNQLGAIQSLLTSDMVSGVVGIYGYTQKGLYLLGVAKEQVEDVILTIVRTSLDEGTKVWKNVSEDSPGTLLESRDITKIRLHL